MFTITNEFEKWCNKVAEGKFPGSNANAHFWLSAFVREARRRAEIVGDTQYLSDALEELVREFGLDSDKEKP